MTLKELKAMAKNLGIKRVSGIKKAALIQAIQTAEGNFACFGTAEDYCDQADCAFRSDCLK